MLSTSVQAVSNARSTHHRTLPIHLRPQSSCILQTLDFSIPRHEHLLDSLIVLARDEGWSFRTSPGLLPCWARVAQMGMLHSMWLFFARAIAAERPREPRASIVSYWMCGDRGCAEPERAGTAASKGTRSRERVQLRRRPVRPSAAEIYVCAWYTRRRWKRWKEHLRV